LDGYRALAFKTGGVLSLRSRNDNDFAQRYRSLQESYIDTLGPFGDVVISLLASIAKLEREKIRERTLAGLARARKAGRVGGRPRAQDDHKVVQGVHKLQAEGKSIRATAMKLKISPTTVLKLRQKN
jgi:DNA invertase Pin-like site-specific DNA recombinase